MSQQKLTIKTSMELDEAPFGKDVSRTIWVDSAFQSTVHICKDKAEKCFRVEAGLKSLLKFFALTPAATKKEKEDGKEKSTAVDLPRNKLHFSTAGPAAAGVVQKNGPADISSPKLSLSDSQTYVEGQIDLLFGKDQGELETITFFNYTGYDVAVTIIQGRDMTPCDPDGAETCENAPAEAA